MGRIRAEALEKTQFGQILCVHDVDTSQRCSYQRTRSVDEIIENREIDAIFVCTPNYLIPPLVMAGLRAGKHVFAEKPPAFDASQMREIMDVESASGKKLMYGFNHRHHESIKRMKGIIDSGNMGKVLWLRGRYGKEVDDSFFKGWRADPVKAGGGILLDQGIHMLDLFLNLAGPFDEVHAFVSNLFWKIDGIEDNVFSILRSSETGVCASLHSTMTQWRYLFSLEIFLEKGALILNGLKTSSGAYGDEVLSIKYNTSHCGEGRFEREETLVYHTDDSWESEVRHFCESIRDNNPIEHGNTIDAHRIMCLIDAIYQKQHFSKNC